MKSNIDLKAKEHRLLTNYRQRFAATLNHATVDRVPFDLCGSPFTNILHKDTVNKLRDILGITGAYSGWYERFDERILNFLDIDFRRVGGMIQPESELSYYVPGKENVDCWGLKRIYNGQYWEFHDPPLRGATIEDLDRYPWPQAERIDHKVIDGYREQARRLYTETDYVVCAEHPVYGVLELGCWMCGYDEFLLKMALEPGFVIKLFDILLEYQKQVIEIYYGAIGEYIHFTTSGDDFGTQSGPFISRPMFQQLVAPYYVERICYTKKYTDAYYLHHTCGSVYKLLPDIISAGVDILNPIQPTAKDMELDRLARDYGSQLTFHGGIDTQNILPYGTVADVKREVYKVLDTMAAYGGYILAPAHNIQPDVPAENILALYEAGPQYYQKRK